jgi:hypothetical protein
MFFVFCLPTSGRPIFFLMCPHVEGIDPAVISELTVALAARLAWCPIIFAFGVATGSSTLHSIFSAHAIRRISVQRFTLPAASTYLNKLIQSLLFSTHFPGTFKMSLSISSSSD